MAREPPPGFRRIFRRELRQIAARPAFAFMLGPYPLVLFLLLAAIFSAGLPTGLPVAVVDQDGSALSRQAVQMIDATPELAVTARLPNLTEAKQALLADQVYGIVLIPQHTERDVLRGSSPEIAVFYNNQMLTIGSIVSRASNAALGTLQTGIAIGLREAQGQSADEAAASANPIPIQQSPLFNPALDYTQYLLAAVMPTVLQIFLCASGALAFARDRDSRGGIPRLVRLGHSPLRAMCGKLAPYALAFLATLALADALVFGYFGAPFRGSIPFHILYTVVFVCSCLLLGSLIALFTLNAVGALGIVGLLTGPAFGFVGIGFPRLGMNGFARAWGDMLPLTAFLQLRTDQAVRGAPVEVSLPAFGWALALMVIYGTLAFALLAKQAHPAPAAAAPEPEPEPEALT